MKVLHTAEATATGGRNGQVKSDNGVLDLQVRAPKAMGGANDDYTNPSNYLQPVTLLVLTVR